MKDNKACILSNEIERANIKSLYSLSLSKMCLKIGEKRHGLVLTKSPKKWYKRDVFRISL